ncbi:MAG: hypothetical protein BZY80_05815 [SAR202 cluster bacterium Io17-Chloro-G2]|nr:MAG: hypothetical protein BZY80_05815 [SAR202 cluster bacterium Io17-Chloro-G2]
MATGKSPAFYALPGAKGWQDYVNLLHMPYTLWHLSYVVLGAAISPTVHLDRLLGTLLAFFLAVGIASHALDELNDRPLGTKIPPVVLVSLAVVSLAGALALGVVAGILETPWIFAFVAFGGFIVVFYNLGLWHNRFHTDLWFAFSWGAFPVLTSYWVNASRLDVAALLLAAGCFFLTLVQRTLSTPVRTIRRKALNVEGYIELADGERLNLDSDRMIAVPERALVLLGAAIVVLAAGVLTFRLQTQ